MSRKNRAKGLVTGLRRIPGGTLCIMTKTDGGVGCCGRKSYKVLKNFWLFCYHLVNKWTFCPSDRILFLCFSLFWAVAPKGPMTYAFWYRGIFSFSSSFFSFFFFFSIHPPLSLGPKLISKLGGSNLILQKIPLCAAPLTAITTTTNYRGATGTVDHLHLCDFSIYSHFLTKTAKTSH